MSADWVGWVVAAIGWLLNIVTYKLGVKNQREQILGTHITDIVKTEYPALYSEINSRTERLDNYLENLEVGYGFPKLEEFYKTGLFGLMEKHHKDLFLSVERFKKEVAPKYEEFVKLNTSIRGKLWEDWAITLEKWIRERNPDIILIGRYLFPKEINALGRNISNELIRSVNTYNVFSELLNGRYDVAKKRIVKCLVEGIPKFIQKSESDLDEISDYLIELAKPEIQNILKCHVELKEQNDKMVKDGLLILLQKYISNPI